MKRICSVFIFISLAAVASGQGPKFEIKFSEPLAVFVYVERLSSKYPDNTFKKQFLNSLYNREKYKNLLLQYDTLRINYTYDYEEFPYASKTPGMTEALIKRNLATSANLKEFKRRSIGVIPNANLLQLSAILYEFQQVYRELVYQPLKTKFEKQLTEITDFIKTKNIADYFDKGLFFYKSYWEESLPFEITFYPMPGNEIAAEAFFNNAVSSLQTDSKNYTVLMSVMLHEIFHILYDEQPLPVKSNISKWFAASSSTCSIYAYHLLNEALATALGNGFVYESLHGKPDEEDWYNWKYIDKMAKKIYPTVHDYVVQKKAIDLAFVNTYIKLYEENFSTWLNELDNLMCYRYVLTDNADDFRVINQKFPHASFSQYEDKITENSVDKLKASAITKVIFVSKENEARLLMIKKRFPELKAWKYKAKQDFLHSVFLEDKTQLIIVNTVKKSTEEMLNGLVLLPQQNQVK